MDRKIQKAKKFSWKHILLVAAVVVIAALYVNMPKAEKSLTVEKERLVFSTVKKVAFEDYISLRVRVEPFKSVYLDAIEGGRVEDVLVEEGDIVIKNQPLLRLSNTKLQLDLISREAQVSEQLNDLRNTKLAIERNRLSLKRDLIELDYQIKQLQQQVKRRRKVANFIDEEQLENLTNELAYLIQCREVTLESQEQEEKMRIAQIEQLESNVAQLEKNLSIARRNLDNLLVKAPRAGRLTSFDIEMGESKSHGERLGQIDDISKFKAVGLVSEFYLSRLAIGQKARVNIAGNAYVLTLKKIYPQINNNEFEIDLHFDDDWPKSIRRGQTLTPRLMLSDNEEVLLIDSGAFMQESAGTWVYVVNENGKQAHRRNITIGRNTPAQVEIIQGLKEGEMVIVSSYSNFNQLNTITIEDN
ncbi:efflux RND transporter periplasmic adaptor subunit [Thalassotalea agariperforans]